MVTVIAGSDVYGAVRRVDRTPIVTKFAMLQFLPLVPLESYYLHRVGKRSGLTIPLLAGYSSQPISGLRLARLDPLSVVVTYMRGLGAALALFGAIGLFGIVVSSFTGARGRDQEMITIGSAVVLGVGMLIALPTYYFTLVVPHRDRAIRQTCAYWLGIAADPASINADDARQMLSAIDRLLVQHDITDAAAAVRSPQGAAPDSVRLLLMRTRAQIAVGGDRDPLERDTDNLILALPVVPRSA